MHDVHTTPDKTNSVSFIGMIDTYPAFKSPLSETDFFLKFLHYEFSICETSKDSTWWDNICQLTVNEAIEKMQQSNLDLNYIDIEWEALLSKHVYNYENICAAFQIDSLPIQVHLFKSVGFYENDTREKTTNNYRNSFNYPKLGWEKCNPSIDFNIISVDGDHYSMISDPKNRSLLGRKLTKFLQQKIIAM